MSAQRNSNTGMFASGDQPLASEAWRRRGSDFPEISEIVRLCDRVASARDADSVTGALAADIAQFIRRHPHSVPVPLRIPSRDGPRRVELYRDPAWRFQLLLVVLGPGQTLPLHDHSGAWGVEAVWCGGLLVADFAIDGRSGDAVHLRPRDAVHLGAAESTTLAPRHNVHHCRNTSIRGTTVFLHVHGAVLDEVTVYRALGDDWYQPFQTPLAVEKLQLGGMDLADRHVDTYS